MHLLVSFALARSPLLRAWSRHLQQARFNNYSPQAESQVARYMKLSSDAFKIPAVGVWFDVSVVSPCARSIPSRPRSFSY